MFLKVLEIKEILVIGVCSVDDDIGVYWGNDKWVWWCFFGKKDGLLGF